MEKFVLDANFFHSITSIILMMIIERSKVSEIKKYFFCAMRCNILSEDIDNCSVTRNG